MRVCFATIIYDKDPEHRELEDLIASAEKAGFTDWVFAADAKSTPDTEDWLKQRLPAADVFPFVMEREDGVEDFARARNLALARVPKECEWWGWGDRDDTIEMVSGKTVPEILADLPERDRNGLKIAAIFFDYDYARDEFNNSTTDHIKGRLYRNDLRWEWRNRVHEDCYPLDGDFGTSLAILVNDEDHMGSVDLRWIHHIGDRPSSYERNMRILRKMVEDNPNEPRTWYYLGNQHFAQHEFAEAAEAFEKYIGMSGWDQEKWTALIYQGISYQQLEKYKDALGSYTRAMLLMPELPDSYFGLGEVHARVGDWAKGRHFGELGIQRVAAGTLPDKTVFFNANAYQFNPYMWLATCYWNLQEPDLALAAYEQAAKARPEKDLLEKIEHLKWAMARERIIRNGLDLAAGLIRRNEPLKSKAILEALPAGASERTDVQQAKRLVAKETAHLYDDILYRNHYFRSEADVDPLKWLDVPSAGVPRIDWNYQKLKGSKKVLQVGIGSGIEGLYLAKRGIEVIGIDVNPLAVKEANWASVRAGLMGTKTVRIATDEEAKEEDIEPTMESPDMTGPYRCFYSDVRNIALQVLEQGPFDAVLASELIEHVPDAKEMLRTLSGLAPQVLLSTPDGAWDGPQERHKDHVRAYSLRELATELSSQGVIWDLHTSSSAQSALADNLVARYLPGKLMQGDRVVIYCGNTGQGWSPDSIRQGGIGGSETAVIRMAEELVNKGYRVKVWAECEGFWNGVTYSFAEDFVPWECELFISWRHFGPIHKVKAENKWLWCHDAHFGPATEEQLKGIRVIALSKWHAGFLKKLYPTAEVMVSGNGIDPERFYKEVERIPHRLIYAQSPDRGLNVILRSWPKIREKHPDATLEVFYGFDMARQRNPDFIASIEEMAKQEGVTLHGRVDQERLAEEYLRSDVLLYPSEMPDGEPFTETFCISVVEAQAAGCVPITPSWGALHETNHEGIQTDDLLTALSGFWSLSEKRKGARRKKCREWARKQTWTRVVEGWLSEIEVREAVSA